MTNKDIEEKLGARNLHMRIDEGLSHRGKSRCRLICTRIGLIGMMFACFSTFATVTYSWSNCENFSVERCPAEHDNVVGEAMSFLSGSNFRQTTCRNGLHMEAGWKATMTYSVAVAKDMKTFTVMLAPILSGYEIDGYKYSIATMIPTFANLGTITAGKSTFSTSGGTHWISVECKQILDSWYMYYVEDSYGRAYNFSATQTPATAGVYFMVTTGGGANQQIAYSVDTKVEWASGSGSGGGGTGSGSGGGTTGSGFEIKDGVLVKYTGSGGDVKIPFGVTNIAARVFQYCSSIRSVTIPASVKSMGDEAFHGSNLRTVVIEDGVPEIGRSAFASCGFLESVTIPSSVTRISDTAFYNCSWLNYITLPDSVTYIGDRVFSECNHLKSISIPQGVKYIYEVFSGCSDLASVTIHNGVKEICSKAFQRCGSLSSIVIPDSVTSIGDNAFEACASLKSVSIPSSVTTIGNCAFMNCTGLESVSLSEGIAQIRGGAFYGCSSLTSVSIPPTVGFIGGNVFYGCDRLGTGVVVVDGCVVGVNGTCPATVELPQDIRLIASEAFYGCKSLSKITIPKSITQITSSAFRGCTGLVSVEIPESVRSIGSYAFYGCSSLETLLLPDGLTKIEGYAFYGCSSLGTLTLPDGLTEIGSSAFSGCLSLSAVSIPNGVSELGDYVFANCTALAELSLPTSVMRIAANAFNGCSGLGSGIVCVDGCAFPVDKTRPTSIDFPKGTRLLADGIFSGCTSLRSVTLPEGVKRIGSSAFSGCTSLASVAFPEGVECMGGSAFSGCSLLQSVVIPSSVKSIGGYAFENCTRLTSLKLSDGLPSFEGYYAFKGCAGLTSVTIPASMKKVQYGTFYKCTGLQSVILNEGVAEIGTCAFEECSALHSVSIPSTVESIGRFAFRGCGKLGSGVVSVGGCVLGVNGACPADVVLPANTRVIAEAAFYKQETLKSIEIPEGVFSIGYMTFESCPALTSVELPKSLTIIDDSAFCDCPRLNSVRIPDGVISIGAYAFGGCSDLTSVIIPQSVTQIGYRAFAGCGCFGVGVALIDGCVLGVNGVCPEAVDLPTGTRVIADKAFAGCAELKTVTIPSSVSEIGQDAFSGCEGLWMVMVDGGDAERVKRLLSDSGVETERLSFAEMSAPPVVQTVTFDANGGSIDEKTRGVVQGTAIGSLPIGIRHGYEFLGWFTAAVGGTQVSEETAVTADMVLYAHWRLEGTPVCVPGEKAEIDTGLVGYTVSGLPAGLTYNRTTGMITGAATRPGEYAVKFAKGGAETEEMTIIVTAVPKIVVEMVGVNAQSDTNGCKVTGAKEYLAGTRATLAVTVPTGTMFEGWFRDDQPWPDEATHLNKSVTYTMGKEDVALVAKFKKEVMTVGCDLLEYGMFTAGVACGFGSGILLDEGIKTESGIKSIAVNKLPTGMKFDARTHLLTGWPTKAGSNRVEIVVTANSGSVERKYVDLVVAALPAWAVGDFAGNVTCADGTHGTASMKIDATGKVTNGKLLEHGSNWTFTASSYASSSILQGLEQDYVVFADAKCGKAEREIELHVTGWAAEGVAENAASAAGAFGDADVELWRSVWKDADAKGVVAGIAGKYTYFFADGTPLPLDLKATAALSGKANIRARDNASVSFSTSVFASTNGVEAAFYVAPDARKGYAEIYERFCLVPESGERDPGVAHRNPGVVAVPESYPGDSGSGTVSVSPAGGQVDAGKAVTVSATPDAKSVFVKWRYEVGGKTLYSEMSKLTLEMDGEHDVFAYAVFRSKGSFAEPVVAVETSEQAKFAALELGVQFSAFVTVTDVENMKPVKWSAANLPSGLKINAETGEISGVATAVNTKPVVLTATSVADPKKKTTFTLDIGAQGGKPAALPETAVGTFTGFANDGANNVGTFTFTSSEKGALSAKVVDAAGTVSFSGSGFGKSEDGKLYVVDLKTTKGEKLSLTLDSGAGWDSDQLTGSFTTAKGAVLGVTSQRNAFSKAWYFAAEGDEATGWTFSFTADAKAAALTVTLKADGTTSVAGKLPNGVDKYCKTVTLPVSASGVANVGMMEKGAMSADFAPVLTVGGTKKVLAIRTNLWFDRKNDHGSGVGEARFVE